MVTDARLTALVERFGRTHAQAAWDAGRAAIAQIDEIACEHDIDCAFKWVDGYLHAPDPRDGTAEAEPFHEEAKLACELGFDATFAATVPFAGGPGHPFSRPGPVPSAAVPRRRGPRAHRRRRPHLRAQRGGGVPRDAAGGEGQRSLGVVRRHRDRDAQSARRHRQHGQRHGVPDQAVAVYELRRGRPRAARHRSRRTVLGHRRSLSLRAPRAAPRPRPADCRR